MPTSDAERRYGRQGGGWLPKRTPEEQRADFLAAVAAGQVTLARCACLWWWVTPATLAMPDVDRWCPQCNWPLFEATDSEKAAELERKAAA